MKLVSFQIKNFRSITDSGECIAEQKISILAGKNESGKSNILLALSKFSSEKYESLDKNLFENSEKDVEITTKWVIEEDDINSFEYIKNKYLPSENECILTVTKKLNEKGCEIITSGSFFDWINKIVQETKNLLIKDHDILLSEILKNSNKNETTGNLKNLQANKGFDIYTEIQSLAKIDLSIINENQAVIIQQHIEDLNKRAGECSIASSKNYIDGIIKQTLPKFVLFDSFSDILPDVYKNEEALTPILERFFKLSGIDPEALFNDPNYQSRRLKTSRTSQSVSGDFANYYSQDKVSIEIQLDGHELCFFIYDDDSEKKTPFSPRQRSKGFQWFLSFYITLNAEESKRRIILIDEPGLYLHAKAQQDILLIINKLSTSSQVIFSTHSPYLIDAKNLGQIRLVLKKKNEQTIIQNKFNKGSDKETLTPIITAMGLDLSKEILLSGKLNVIVEGITDYYYITTMSKKVQNGLSKDIHIIPSIGASQMNNLVSILYGWRIDFICLFDNDKEGKTQRNDIQEKFLLDESVLLSVSEIDDFCIEDLFSRNDFYKYVVEQKVEQNDKKNSKIFKDLEIDTIKSKTLQDRILSSDIHLEKETISNFEMLFSRINKHIEA